MEPAAGARSMRARGQVNYKEPSALGGLYKNITPNKIEEGDSDDDSDLEVKPKKRGRPPASSSQAKRSSPSIIREKPTAVPVAIGKWWQDYATKKDEAVMHMTNMVLETGGCRQRLNPNLFRSNAEPDADDEVREIVSKSAAEGQIENYMTGQDKLSRKIRERLANFWQKLIVHAPREHVVNFHANPFCTWLFAFSTAHLAMVRHSAAIAGLEILVGIATVGSEVLNDISNKHRQLDAANASGGESNAAQQKRQRLKEELESLSNEKALLESEMEELFNAIFVHRHRDSDKFIRARCMVTLGELIDIYKPKFLVNQSLKYLGWGLNDKMPEVRINALDAVAKILVQENHKELESFITRFKDRIFQMRFDKDSGVAVKAIHACSLVLKLSREYYNEDQLVGLYSMITEADEEIRAAAATFISDNYIEEDLVAAFDNAHKGANVSNKDFLLKGVVELVHRVACDTEDLSPIVESLKEANEDWGWQDWPLMCQVMEEEDEENGIQPEEKQTLAKILAASLMLTPQSAIEFQKEKKSSRSKTEESNSGTALLIAALPGLMSKLGAEVPLLTLLFKVLQQLHVQEIPPSSVKALEKIVNSTVDALLKGQDSQLLEAAAQALGHLNGPDCQMRELVSSGYVMLADSISKQVAPATAALAKGAKIAVANALGMKRAAYTAGCIDLDEFKSGIFKVALEAVEAVAKHPDNSANLDFGRHAVLFALNSFMWRVTRSAGSEDSAISKEDNASLLSDRSALIKAYQSILDATSSLPLRTQVLAAVGDLVHMFGDMPNKGVDAVPCKEMGKLIPALESVMNVQKDTDQYKAACDSMLLNADVLPHDEEDKGGLVRTCALVVMHAVGETSVAKAADKQAAADLMQTVSMQEGYSQQMRTGVSEYILARILSRASSEIEAASTILAAHQQMFLQVTEAANDSEADVESLTYSMVQSVSGLDHKLTNAGTMHYISNALEWVMKDVAVRVGFLDAVSLHGKNLTQQDANTLLFRLEDLCGEQGIDLRAASNTPHTKCLIAFRHRLNDALGSYSSHPPTPGTAGKSAKKRALETPSSSTHTSQRMSQSTPSGVSKFSLSQEEGGEGTADLPPSGAKRGRPKGSGSGAKRGRKPSKSTEPDEVDDEGFTSVKRTKK